MIKRLYEYFVQHLYTKWNKKDSSAFKIYFNQAERISAKTPLRTGMLILGESELEIEGDASLKIRFTDITSLRLEFPHSNVMLAHVIEIKYRPNEILYFGVLRIALFKLFVINNTLRTIALFEKIKRMVPQNLSWSVLEQGKLS